MNSRTAREARPGEEGSNSIAAIGRREQARERFGAEKKKFGRIAVLTNLGMGGKEVYLRYKEGGWSQRSML